MKTFAYRAIDRHGQRVRGRSEAADLRDLEVRLGRLQLDLIHAVPQRPRPWQRPARVARRELIKLCFHLEQFLRAGVPIIDSLTDLRDAIRQPALQQVMAALVNDIEGGLTLSQALARHPAVFDAVFCSLIRAGEHSGRLPDVLHALSDSLKRDDELTAYARRLVIYPAIVASIILAALGVALLYVVPELARLFHSMGQALPWQTRALIALSDFAIAHGGALLGLFAGALLAARQALAVRPALRLRFDAALLRVPLAGKLRRKIILARFSGLFALLYASGIPIVEALRVTEDVLGNSALKEGLQQVGQRIAEGRKVSEAFAAVALFPPLVTRMLRVGETTGGLDTALAQVSYFYDRDVREAIARLQASIEPLLTVVLGSLLLGVMSAVLLPVYDIVTRMKL